MIRVPVTAVLLALAVQASAQTSVRFSHEWRFEGPITFKSFDPLRRNVPAEIAEAIREAEGETQAPPPKKRKS